MALTLMSRKIDAAKPEIDRKLILFAICFSAAGSVVSLVCLETSHGFSFYTK